MVFHMVAGFLDVVRRHVFKGKHPLNVQVPGAGYQIAGVSIFGSQLVANQVAAVVQVFAIHAVISHGMPAAGFDLPYAATFFGGHEVLSYAGCRSPAAPKGIKRAIRLVGFREQIASVKIGNILIEYNIRLPGIRRYILNAECCTCWFGGLRLGIVGRLIFFFGLGGERGRGLFRCFGNHRSPVSLWLGSCLGLRRIIRLAAAASGQKHGQKKHEGQQAFSWSHRVYTSLVIFS